MFARSRSRRLHADVTARCAAFGLLVALALVGCGGAKAPSKAAYVKKANAICTQFNNRGAAATRGLARNPQHPTPREALALPIPEWYHFGMSRQIAVRLPDDVVEFLDAIVGSGRERSRAAVVLRALERERRRVVAERDAAILADAEPDPELAGLAEHVARLDRDV